MDLIKAQDEAHSLMKEHGLFEEVAFKFDKARSRFGRYQVRRNRVTGEITERTISLSRKLTEINDEKDVIDTIKHEIAHALVGHREGHSWVWKSKASEIGARPVACFSVDEVNVSYKWTGSCLDCGYTFKRHRLTNGLMDGIHRPCKRKLYGGALNWKEIA